MSAVPYDEDNRGAAFSKEGIVHRLIQRERNTDWADRRNLCRQSESWDPAAHHGFAAGALTRFAEDPFDVGFLDLHTNIAMASGVVRVQGKHDYERGIRRARAPRREDHIPTVERDPTPRLGVGK